MNRKGMKKTELLNIMSAPTLAKLSKGEIIKTDIIDKICIYLNCQPGDIMECVHDRNEAWKAEKELLKNPLKSVREKISESYEHGKDFGKSDN